MSVTHRFQPAGWVHPKFSGPTLGLGGGANEPSGYTKVVEWDAGHELFPFLQAGSSGCDEITGLDGSGLADSSDDTYVNTALASVADAPQSGPEVLEQTYPEGQTGESLREKLWLWRTPTSTGDSCDIVSQSPDSEDHYEKIYIREHRQIWTDQGDGTAETFESGGGCKLAFVSGDLTGGSPRGVNINLGLNFDTGQAFVDRGTLKARVLWYDNAGNSHPDVYVASAANFTFTDWHELEWLIEMNTVAGDGSANADGALRCWLNGSLEIEATGIKMRSGFNSRTESPFQNYNHAITWSGGPTDTHTHDKGNYIDHLYVSGEAAA